MDPVHLWVDPAEVRRLAQQLMRPHCEADEEVVGEVTAEYSSDAVSAPPQAEIPMIASSPLLDRIGRFRDWMRNRFAGSDLFILDGEGTVIFDESPHGRLHFLARGLALASDRPEFSAGSVHVKISAGATLEIIPVVTASGPMVLGAMVAEPLASAVISEVAAALSQAAAPLPED